MKHEPDCKSPELMRFDPTEDYITVTRRQIHLDEVKKRLTKLAKNDLKFVANFNRVEEFIQEISLQFYLRYKRVLIIPNIALLDDDSIDLEWMVGDSDALITFPNDLTETIEMSGGNQTRNLKILHFKDYGVDMFSDYKNLVDRIIPWLTDFKRNRAERCASCNALMKTEDLRKP